MKPDICLYHSPCADGFTSAWAVHQRWSESVEYMPVNYGQKPPDVTGKNVLIVDFSYPYDVLVEMSRQAASIVILDHHKTAHAALSRLIDFGGKPDGLDDAFRYCEMQGMPRIVAHFNMEHSGAVLTWNYCFPGKSVPWLIRLVEDRDLWRFHYSGTRAVHAVLTSHPWSFEIWSEMERRTNSTEELDILVREGLGIERATLKHIHEMITSSAYTMKLDGVEVPVLNCPPMWASEAGHIMCKGKPFAALYYDVEDQRRFSLRSSDDGSDVSEVAKRYGGGGHRNAAGFSVAAGWRGE